MALAIGKERQVRSNSRMVWQNGDRERAFVADPAGPPKRAPRGSIERRRIKVRTPRRVLFNGTVLDEFFRVKLRENLNDSVEALQDDLDAWLIHYNTGRPHLGYRNMGKRTIETVVLFVSQED